MPPLNLDVLALIFVYVAETRALAASFPLVCSLWRSVVIGHGSYYRLCEWMPSDPLGRRDFDSFCSAFIGWRGTFDVLIDLHGCRARDYDEQEVRHAVALVRANLPRVIRLRFLATKEDCSQLFAALTVPAPRLTYLCVWNTSGNRAAEGRLACKNVSQWFGGRAPQLVQVDLGGLLLHAGGNPAFNRVRTLKLENTRTASGAPENKPPEELDLNAVHRLFPIVQHLLLGDRMCGILSEQSMHPSVMQLKSLRVSDAAFDRWLEEPWFASVPEIIYESIGPPSVSLISYLKDRLPGETLYLELRRRQNKTLITFRAAEETTRRFLLHSPKEMYRFLAVTVFRRVHTLSLHSACYEKLCSMSPDWPSLQELTIFWAGGGSIGLYESPGYLDDFVLIHEMQGGMHMAALKRAVLASALVPARSIRTSAVNRILGRHLNQRMPLQVDLKGLRLVLDDSSTAGTVRTVPDWILPGGLPYTIGEEFDMEAVEDRPEDQV